jgi:hypothetical protein
MKLRKQGLFSLVLLVLLIVGVFALINPAGSIITADQVKFTPKHYDLANGADLGVQIKLTDELNVSIVEEIDNTSVTLEGSVPPMTTWIEYNEAGNPSSYQVVFEASAVTGVIWHIIQHMDIARPNPWVPIPLRLTVSGKLIDGTTLWEGSAILSLYNWAGGPPPPPP